MKNLLTILLLLPFLAQSQTEKGASPIATHHSSLITHHSTYAVVVGISDYQDAAIPDLRFADRDAEAFANFLRSPAGGSLDGDHLMVLTNSEATQGQFGAALDWLLETCKEGDQAIIYFSGHGDVEKKSLTQPGYLLCWNAPAKVYIGGGALALPMFQDVISTLSVQNKAKVIVITDACHSGKLSGNEIYGAQLTGQNLARQYANEIKMLSCQPNEYSIEGEQWGGGRGAFSYNLVQALYGMADGNNDLTVTLQEAARYLEDHVTTEVAPVTQVPMVIGNRTERLASVDSKLLADLRSGKTNQMQLLSPVETRGMEDDVLATVDTTIQELYRLFKKALQDKALLAPNVGEPATACADVYYERLMAEPKMKRLHTAMTRNYAAALQDDAQQTLNEWLKTNQDATVAEDADVRLPQKLFTEKVRTYPRCLDRAAELLGEQHYMYASLKARRCFFEGYLLANSNRNPNLEVGEHALDLFRQSLAWQSEQPHVYWQMSEVFGYNLVQPDSLERYARLALEEHPNWTRPCTDAAFWLSHKYRQQERARPFLEQAIRIDSSSAQVWDSWAVYYLGEKNYEEAERKQKKALALDSTLVNVWSNLGFTYTNTRRYAEAEEVYKKCLALDSTNAPSWNSLGILYFKTRRYAEAEPVFKKAIALDSANTTAWNNLGLMYFNTRRYSEAEPVFKKAIALDSANTTAWSNLGVLYNTTRRYSEAEPILKKAIALDSTNFKAWTNLGFLYKETRRFAEAEPAYKKALALDSTSFAVWNNLGNMYNTTLRYAEAESALKKAVALDSTNARTWNNLGFAYNMTQRFADAEEAHIKAVALDSAFASAWMNLGHVYFQTRRYAEAEPALKKSIALDSAFANPRKHLGMVCFKTNRPEEARQHFLKAIALNPNYAGAMLGMAYLLAAEGKTEEALGYVEQAIGKGITFEQLQSDEDLAPLRALPEWKALMKKHFPDKVKD